MKTTLAQWEPQRHWTHRLKLKSVGFPQDFPLSVIVQISACIWQFGAFLAIVILVDSIFLQTSKASHASQLNAV